MVTKKKIFIWVCSFILVLTVISGACAVYLCNYYKADDTAVSAFLSTGKIKAEEQGNITVFAPEGASSGLIFYPGGKVDHTAYYPLIESCAEYGILCVIVKMPFRLAVLDINAADGIREIYPEIESWYIGGHSLGGSMAASYLGEHKNEFKGLFLLGSYSTENLRETDISVLSIYGSEDLIMNRQKYEEYKTNLPAGFIEYIIEGGSHAGFGMYGVQDGDGIATISNEEQIKITAKHIADFVF